MEINHTPSRKRAASPNILDSPIENEDQLPGVPPCFKTPRKTFYRNVNSRTTLDSVKSNLVYTEISIPNTDNNGKDIQKLNPNRVQIPDTNLSHTAITNVESIIQSSNSNPSQNLGTNIAPTGTTTSLPNINPSLGNSSSLSPTPILNPAPNLDTDSTLLSINLSPTTRLDPKLKITSASTLSPYVKLTSCSPRNPVGLERDAVREGRNSLPSSWSRSQAARPDPTPTPSKLTGSRRGPGGATDTEVVPLASLDDSSPEIPCISSQLCKNPRNSNRGHFLKQNKLDPLKIDSDAKILLVGDSNLKNFTSVPKDWQVVCMPGLSTSQLTSHLKKSPIPDTLEHIIISVGINDRTTSDTKALEQCLLTAKNTGKHVHFCNIVFSDALTKLQINNLQSFNRLARNTSGVQFVPMDLENPSFSDYIHFDLPTANTIFETIISHITALNSIKTTHTKKLN